MNQEKYLKIIIEAAIAGGEEIMKIYKTNFEVDTKEDDSPLTQADRNAHLKIVEYLEQTDLPLLSEEGKEMPYSERKAWSQFWMVDPLDGTKEFIKKNGEFTVNIALIDNSKPVMGVVYVPVSKELYFASKNTGAYKAKISNNTIDLNELIGKSEKLPVKIERPFTVVGSRSHMSKETEDFIELQKSKVDRIEVISKGSSLKLCMVAEGKADAYPRFAPTMEWDTAAGQAIVENASCQVIDWSTKEEMVYNKENLLNNWFLVTNGKAYF